jgi:alanyl-tRNA synthetase
MKTTKLFYTDSFLTSCEATIIAVNDKGVVTDQTVAFPEGGGQEGDHGFFVFSNLKIPFVDTQKGIGRTIFLNDFPTIQVDNPIYHVIDSAQVQSFSIDDRVAIEIDVQRRMQLTIAHTGLHLILMALERLRPDIASAIKGCHITPDYARMDFSVNEKFNEEELLKVKHIADQLITKDLPISVFAHSQEPEAWFWQCEDRILPCGGTHLPSTGYVGSVILKRKNLGKNLERIIASFPNATLPNHLYHQK